MRLQLTGMNRANNDIMKGAVRNNEAELETVPHRKTCTQETELDRQAHSPPPKAFVKEEPRLRCRRIFL